MSEREYASVPEKESYYGRAWINIFDKNREEGLFMMRSLCASDMIIAKVALAMFVSSPEERKALLLSAAELGNAEAMWQYSVMLPHSFAADKKNSQDSKWVMWCTKAAKAGCADAMNELGNLYHRRKAYAESMYWYAMANYHGHPQGSISIQGITQEWVSAGAPKKYTPNDEEFTKQRFQTALVLLEMNSGMNANEEAIEALVEAAMSGEKLAGYVAADFFEYTKNYEMTGKIYDALCVSNDALAMKCLGDMYVVGRGVPKDETKAYELYNRAAELGERSAMFIMGEHMKEQDMFAAAYWYGQAHACGNEYAQGRLKQLVQKMKVQRSSKIEEYFAQIYKKEESKRTKAQKRKEECSIVKVSSDTKWIMVCGKSYYGFVDNSRDEQQIVRTPKGAMLCTSYRKVAEAIFGELQNNGLKNMEAKSILTWHCNLLDDFIRKDDGEIIAMLDSSFLKKADWSFMVSQDSEWKTFFGEKKVRIDNIRAWLNQCTKMQLIAVYYIANTFFSINLAYTLALLMETFQDTDMEEKFQSLAKYVEEMSTQGTNDEIVIFFENFKLYYGMHLKERVNKPIMTEFDKDMQRNE